METLERIISEHPFFSGLEERHLKLIVGCASNVRFEAGDFIARQGEEATQFYFIRHGKVSVEIFVPEQGSVSILTLGDGDIVGWSWLLPPYRWRMDTRAIELTRAIALDGKCLRNKSEQDHDLGYELLKRFAHILEERLEATRLQLLNVYETRT